MRPGIYKSKLDKKKSYTNQYTIIQNEEAPDIVMGFGLF